MCTFNTNMELEVNLRRMAGSVWFHEVKLEGLGYSGVLGVDMFKNRICRILTCYG